MENNWMGYQYKNLQFENHEAIIVYPKEGTTNGYLTVKTEYWGAFPEAIEIPLLENGIHLCYIKNDVIIQNPHLVGSKICAKSRI